MKVSSSQKIVKLLISFLFIFSFIVEPTANAGAQDRVRHPAKNLRRPIYAQASMIALADQVETPPALLASTVNGITLDWFTCGTCPQTPEVSVSSNTIKLGVANRGESLYQNMAIHGVSAALPGSTKYTISFDFDLYTWDSYQPSGDFKGYWDSYSISVTAQPYWEYSLTDPITKNNFPGLGIITGGSIWGQGRLQRLSGSKTVVINGNPSGTNYLNVILDTNSSPLQDNAYPSWGTITIKSIVTDSSQQSYAAHAADVAKTVVTAPYLWGGQGYDWISKPRAFVSSQGIFDGYNYLKYDSETHTSTYPFDKGLDCAGLVLWAYNKDVSPTSRFGGIITVEGADSIYRHNTVDVNEADLLPGDLLFFGYTDANQNKHMTHVAMYVGGSDPAKSVVEAAKPGVGIIYSNKDERKKADTFLGFRRVSGSEIPFAVKVHSPVTLVVTDPDGNTIDADTVLVTDEEQLHEIPGELYYLRDDDDGDMVLASTLKPGFYSIKVVPKPGTQPTDPFSIDVIGDGKYVELARDVPVSDIPVDPFYIYYDGIEIIPLQPTLIYDIPEVLSITRTAANPAYASYVSFMVNFAESVNGVDVDDFIPVMTDVTGAMVVDVYGSDTTYTVTVYTGTGDGKIRLDLIDNNSIVDASNNSLGGPGLGDGNFSSGEIYALKRTSTFSDVAIYHQYWPDIEVLYANGLTGGCATNPLKFCPDQIMNRGQAAVFMLRGNFGSSYVPPVPTHYFKDDWSKGTWAEPWAEGMRNEGLSAGCLANPPKYCPWDQIPREQAVIFVLRMKYGQSYTPPAATGTLFADMTNPGYYATPWAEQAYKDGLIPNCGTSGGKPKFCPKDLVSRGLGAYMIVRAKNLVMP